MSSPSDSSPSPSPVERVRERLEEHGSEPRSSGDGYSAFCPAHDDHRPSLSLGEGERDSAVLHCHAGCVTEDVLEALGLTARDLFADRGSGRRQVGAEHKRAKREPDPLPTADDLAAGRRRLQEDDLALERMLRDRKVSPETLSALEVGLDRSGRLEVPTRNATGELVNVVSRRAPGTPPSHGAKVLALAGRPRDLWPRPETLREDVVIVEGESDALSATECGLATTSIPGTAFGRSAARWAHRLAGRRVTICFDCDTPGRRAAGQVARELAAHAREVRVIDLDPTRTDGYDLSDELYLSGPEKTRERVEQLTAGAPPVAATLPDGAYAQSLATVDRERIEFLLPGVPIPLGMLSLLAGNAGLGKSQMTAGWAAIVSTGALGVHPAQVLLLNAEDAPGAVIRPRLEAAEANLDRIHLARLRRDGEDVGITLPDDLSEVEGLVEQHAVRLVVVDPVNAFLPASVNSWRDADVRRVLGPLTRLSEQHRCAVVIVAHLSKGQQAEALHRVGGSIAYGAAVRSALLLDRDPDDPKGEQGAQRVLVHAKSNIGAKRPSALYRIEPVEVDGLETSRIVQVGDSPYGPGELFARNAERQGSGERKSDQAETYLRETLGDGEWHAAEDVKGDAFAAAGIRPRTLERAASDLSVERAREGFPARAKWRLTSPAKPLGAPAGTEVVATAQTRFPARKAPEPAPSDANNREVAQLGDTGAVNGHSPAGLAKLRDHIESLNERT